MNSSHWPIKRMLALMSGLILATLWLGGCASIDSPNTDARAWGRPSDYEARANQRNRLFGGFLGWPFFEQQQNEDWLRSH